MTIIEMINEWRKGCSCGPHNPANCPDCTTALVNAIEGKLIKSSKEFDVTEWLSSDDADEKNYLDMPHMQVEGKSLRVDGLVNRKYAAAIAKHFGHYKESK